MKIITKHQLKKIKGLIEYCDSCARILHEAGHKGKAEALENRYIDLMWSLNIKELINDLNEAQQNDPDVPEIFPGTMDALDDLTIKK